MHHEMENVPPNITSPKRMILSLQIWFKVFKFHSDQGCRIFEEDSTDGKAKKLTSRLIDRYAGKNYVKHRQIHNEAMASKSSLAPHPAGFLHSSSSLLAVFDLSLSLALRVYIKVIAATWCWKELRTNTWKLWVDRTLTHKTLRSWPKGPESRFPPVADSSYEYKVEFAVWTVYKSAPN